MTKLKGKMQSKTKEMDTLMKARLSDFKKKASDQQKKLKKEEFIMENDVLTIATQLAAGEIGDTQGFADVQVGEKSMKMDEYSAKRAVAVPPGIGSCESNQVSADAEPVP